MEENTVNINNNETDEEEHSYDLYDLNNESNGLSEVDFKGMALLAGMVIAVGGLAIGGLRHLSKKTGIKVRSPFYKDKPADVVVDCDVVEENEEPEEAKPEPVKMEKKKAVNETK